MDRNSGMRAACFFQENHADLDGSAGGGSIQSLRTLLATRSGAPGDGCLNSQPRTETVSGTGAMTSAATFARPSKLACEASTASTLTPPAVKKLSLVVSRLNVLASSFALAGAVRRVCCSLTRSVTSGAAV